MVSIDKTEPDGASPDSGERIEDFLARHGGPSGRHAQAGEGVAGISGWSEVYAADGYTLRCEWSRSGDHQEMRYTEIAPESR
jgi:hypothetical protein